MSYYDALIAAWNGATTPPAGVSGTAFVAGMTTLQKLAAVATWTVPGPKVDVPAGAVEAYISLNLKLRALKTYANNPPAGSNATAVVAAGALVDHLSIPERPSFQMSQSQTFTSISNLLNLLASDTNSGITASDVTALLALANGPPVPWWKSAGYSSPIAVTDLDAAGGLS